MGYEEEHRDFGGGTVLKNGIQGGPGSGGEGDGPENGVGGRKPGARRA